MPESPTPTYQTIRTELRDHVLTVTLHRPDKLNAFTGTMLAELLDVIDRVDVDDDIRVALVTGAGRGFCAGAHLGEGGSSFRREGEQEEEHRDGGGLLTLRLFESTKAWIAAVNGPAVGVGVTMTLPMDVASSALGNDPHLGFPSLTGYFPVMRQTRVGWQTAIE